MGAGQRVDKKAVLTGYIHTRTHAHTLTPHTHSLHTHTHIHIHGDLNPGTSRQDARKGIR